MTLRRALAALLFIALCSGGGCVFRPIFNPPFRTGADGGVSEGLDGGAGRDSGSPAASDASAADTSQPPASYCSGDATRTSDGGYSEPDGATCTPGVTVPDGGAGDVESPDGMTPPDAAADAAADGGAGDAATTDGGPDAVEGDGAPGPDAVDDDAPGEGG